MCHSVSVQASVTFTIEDCRPVIAGAQLGLLAHNDSLCVPVSGGDGAALVLISGSLGPGRSLLLSSVLPSVRLRVSAVVLSDRRSTRQRDVHHGLSGRTLWCLYKVVLGTVPLWSFMMA